MDGLNARLPKTSPGISTEDVTSWERAMTSTKVAASPRNKRKGDGEFASVAKEHVEGLVKALAQTHEDFLAQAHTALEGLQKEMEVHRQENRFMRSQLQAYASGNETTMSERLPVSPAGAFSLSITEEDKAVDDIVKNTAVPCNGEHTKHTSPCAPGMTIDDDVRDSGSQSNGLPTTPNGKAFGLGRRKSFEDSCTFRLWSDWERFAKPEEEDADASWVGGATSLLQPQPDHLRGDTGDVRHELKEIVKDHTGRYRLANKRSRRVWTINPNSFKRLPWDIMGLLLLGYDTVMIPLLMAFDVERSQFLAIMEVVTMIYWTSDMLMAPFVGYYNRGNTIVMDLRSTAKHYLETWFVIDIFVVCVDWVAFLEQHLHDKEDPHGNLKVAGLARLGRALRILRVFRALKLLRVAKLAETFTLVLEKIDSEQLRDVLDMMKYVVIILTINHLVACLWYSLGMRLIEMNDSDVTWIERYRMDEYSTGYKYATSMHWSLTQFTPASVDIQPQNLVERTYAVIVLMFAMCVFSSFVGSLTAKMTHLRERVPVSRRNLILLRRYLHQNDVSTKLSAKIQTYVSLTLWARSFYVQEKDVEMLGTLTGPLKRELQTEIIQPQLTGHLYMSELAQGSAELMSKVCVHAVDQVSLAASDLLFQLWEQATSMFFLRRGTMRYKTLSEETFTMLEGEWCSEPVLWCEWNHRGRMHACSDCQLLAVESVRFREILQKHPMDGYGAYSYGRRYVAALWRDNQGDEQLATDISTVLSGYLT
eukprot:TRINITY_DN120841_c0_g1_i1.p1 TRINITY_DN120841_c0_g1~~TRINITY_DN120841_c0_g1_i1.p1  ORF type:complete len:762 (-),score=140.38 TRINITY_DN120841_c0_g1_i1:538-2823(-)